MGHQEKRQAKVVASASVCEFVVLVQRYRVCVCMKKELQQEVLVLLCCFRSHLCLREQNVVRAFYLVLYQKASLKPCDQNLKAPTSYLNKHLLFLAAISQLDRHHPVSHIVASKGDHSPTHPIQRQLQTSDLTGCSLLVGWWHLLMATVFYLRRRRR